MEQSQGLQAFIIGATGAVGRELVLELVKSPKWSKITVLVRRSLDEWGELPETEKQKLQIVLGKDLDSLEDFTKWNLEGYSSFFVCLGTPHRYTKETAEMYKQVNYTYPMMGAKLALHFRIPHYSLISAQGIHSQSWFTSMKMRGELEDQLRDLDFKNISIFKPALITDRKETTRFFEKVGKYVPFMPKISAQQLAMGMRVDAELQHSQPFKFKNLVYTNSEIKKLGETGKYPERKE